MATSLYASLEELKNVRKVRSPNKDTINDDRWVEYLLTPLFVDSENIKFVGSDISHEFAKRMLIRFKTPDTAPDYTISELIGVNYDGSDTILTFPTGTFDTSLSPTIARIIEDIVYLSTLISSTSYLIAKIGYDFLVNSYIQKESGGGTDLFFLKHYPVNSITSILVDDGSGEEEQLSYLDDKFRLSPDGYLFRVDDEKWDTHDVITVVYNAGKDLSELPADVKQATLQLASRNIDKSNLDGSANILSTKSKSANKANYSYDISSEPSFVSEVISKYKGYV